MTNPKMRRRDVCQRPTASSSDDDYDVFDGGQHIGRIARSYAAPER
jgi:hypothetical protein